VSGAGVGPEEQQLSTEAQDQLTDAGPAPARRRRRLVAGTAVALLLLSALGAWWLRGWATTDASVARERLRIATVSRGDFVADLGAQATVVAAVSPQLYAPAPGTVTLAVKAGDTVPKGALLATVDSPALRNEYARERATLDSLDLDLKRLELDVRLVEGRNFAPETIRRLPLASSEFVPEVIVTRAFAEALFPGEPALGKQVYDGHGQSARVVGVLETWVNSWPTATVYDRVLLHPQHADPSHGLYLVRALRQGWQVEVRDRGSGMSEEVLANALLPFYSTKATGSGLGLTLCREIVEAHGGTLDLANREGGGVASRIWLPAAPLP
jgi:hypothetical protein